MVEITIYLPLSLIIAFVNVLLAYYHSYLIKKNKHIYHGWWGLGYILFSLGGCLLMKNPLYFILCLTIRGVVFSPILSLFRGLPWNYQSPQGVSIIDKIESKIFYNYTIRTLFYIILTIYLEWKIKSIQLTGVTS